MTSRTSGELQMKWSEAHATGLRDSAGVQEYR
jgi:hypothetical protein